MTSIVWDTLKSRKRHWPLRAHVRGYQITTQGLTSALTWTISHWATTLTQCLKTLVLLVCFAVNFRLTCQLENRNSWCLSWTYVHVCWTHQSIPPPLQRSRWESSTPATTAGPVLDPATDVNTTSPTTLPRFSPSQRSRLPAVDKKQQKLITVTEWHILHVVWHSKVMLNEVPWCTLWSEHTNIRYWPFKH